MTAMAEPPELVEAGTPGATECQSPGCTNWFVKRSGRHIYCKAPDCTYRRGAPPDQQLAAPEGTAEELLKRLQDPEGGGEVGPTVVAPRLRAVSEAQRLGDVEALYGALLDAAVGFVAWADRVRAGTMPVGPIPRAPGLSPKPGTQPVGLVSAVLSSHRRTLVLAERRVEAIWAVLQAREAMQQADAGVEATLGQEGSVAQAQLAAQRHEEYARAERALQSVEAAWAERRVSVQELEQAGNTPARDGGANGRGRAAAA